jgi:hypothetical protein
VLIGKQERTQSSKRARIIDILNPVEAPDQYDDRAAQPHAADIVSFPISRMPILISFPENVVS